MNSYYNEEGYLSLLKDTLTNGEKKYSRNGNVYSQFATSITFDISKSFPLLTTKKMYSKGIICELLWFLQGKTDAKELQENGVHIWDLNSSRDFLDSIGLNHYNEGELGPIYGWQWRHFNKPYPFANDTKDFDQLKYVLDELNKPDNSRRAVISSWNPCQLHQMALPPCHIMYTFYKDSKGLSCMMNMRSSDLFLGLPFNIASTALFTHILAYVLHLPVSKICITATDSHIYEEHIESVHKQLQNHVLEGPTLIINKSPPILESNIDTKIKWIEELKYTDFQFISYVSATSIKAPIK